MKVSGQQGKQQGQKECKKGSQHAVKKMNLLTYLRTHSRVNILRHRFCSCLCTETSHLSPNPSKTQNPGKAAEKREKQGIFLPPSIHPSIQPSIHPSIHPSISTLSLCFSSLFPLYYFLTQSFSMPLFLSLSLSVSLSLAHLIFFLSGSLPLFSTTHSFLIYLNS